MLSVVGDIAKLSLPVALLASGVALAYLHLQAGMPERMASDVAGGIAATFALVFWNTFRAWQFDPYGPWEDWPIAGYLLLTLISACASAFLILRGF